MQPAVKHAGAISKATFIMATRQNTSQQKEEKRDVKVPVTCMDCQYSHLHRYDNNPVLAACHCKPQPDNKRFPFEVEIASVLRLCKPYKKDLHHKEIEQRYKNQAA